MINTVIESIKNRKTNINLTGMTGPETTYLAARLFKGIDSCQVYVLPGKKQAQVFLEDLKFFMPNNDDDILFFPGYNIMPFKSLSYHHKTAAQRISVLYRMITDSSPLIIVTYLDTLLQKVMPKKSLINAADLVINGDEINRDNLIARLNASGYTRTSLVEEPGDYSVRGGILDIFSPGASLPVRIELFGDFVESLREFSPESQRGVTDIEEAVILPAGEAVIRPADYPALISRLTQASSAADLSGLKLREYVEKIKEQGRFSGIESMLSIVYGDLDCFLDYCPDTTVYFLQSPGELFEQAADFTKRCQDNYANARSDNRLCVLPETIYQPWEDVLARIETKNPVFVQALHIEGREDQAGTQKIQLGFEKNPMLVPPADREELLKPLADWLNEKSSQSMAVVGVCTTKSGVSRLNSLLQPYGISLLFLDRFEPGKTYSPGGYVTMGDLSSGFIFSDDRISFITEQEIFGVKKRRVMSQRKRAKSEFIALEELHVGDTVVHIEHGLGRYEGLVTLEIEGIEGDFIKIVYRDNDLLYLPVDRMDMIEKYVGIDGYVPILDKIGGKTWLRSKEKAKKEVEKMAGELLKLYAERRVNKGFAFSPPDSYYNDFEASFPYEETPDQLKAIEDVIADMEDELPMDRLVCGDVGYGKTEVAIRAAFKAVSDGKQVAVIVPTTILAEQHLITFKQRFKDYPVTIEALSRFRTKKEQTVIVDNIAHGRTDIVIGTHRLLQKDIIFKSLGLMVIDEEQRFGVKHKETLKKKRSTVDVLALTATPIPRTLHLSLSGMRDISIITTPPEDRQAIISYMSEYDDAIVSEAIRRELSRNGQIFFVHNVVKTIDKVAARLQKLVPEVRLGIAHGQLTEQTLEKVMHRFLNRSIDMLVCTTIVESGLDIPSANTMIINRADRFGLAQIYQLRGRIGRGEEQAYAYLFVPDENALSRDAQKRLAALMEHRDLGSGFQIAMKDLQIRGAGSALGASQSGHIAAVGYDMFLKLLDEAVADLKGKPVIDPLEPEINMTLSAYISDDYVQSIEQRLTLYRRLSQMTQLSEILALQAELIDRFGKLPEETQNMLLKIMLRILCIKAGVKRLDLSSGYMSVAFSSLHLKKPLTVIEDTIISRDSCEFTSENTLRISLGSNRQPMKRALGKAKSLLQTIASSLNP